MPAKSQRPLVARLLALEPLTVNGDTYAALDDVLDAMSVRHSPEQVSAAFYGAGLDVTVSTLYRWKRETDGE